MSEDNGQSQFIQVFVSGPGEDSIYRVFVFVCMFAYTFDYMCICFLVAFSICLHVCPAHKSEPGVPGGPGNIEPNQQEAPETRISDLWDYPSGNPRAQSAFSTIASCSIFATVCQYLPENRRGTVCQYFVPWPHRAIELLGTGLRSNSSLSSIEGEFWYRLF